MELDPLVDVEDQLTLVLSLQKSGAVCVYLGTPYLYIVVDFGTLNLGIRMFFSNQARITGRVPSRCIVIVCPAIGVKNGMLRIAPVFVYLHGMLKQIHDLEATCIVVWLLNPPKKEYKRVLKDRSRITTSTHSSFCLCAAHTSCQDIDPISSKKMSKISDLCCSNRCFVKTECFD